MRAYFTLGRYPVEANSVVVTICIGGVTAWLDASIKREQARRERKSEL